MSFKLVVRNKLRVPVKGTIKDEEGQPVKFDFVLLCKRLKQAQIDAALTDKDSSVPDFVRSVTTGWEGVLAEDGTALDFDEVALSNVLQEAGMPGVCFGAYLKEVGATAKN